MTLGGDVADIGSGISVLLDTESTPIKLEIMGHSYVLEADKVGYGYSPKSDDDDGIYLDRYSLELTWISPKKYEAGAMIFNGKCEILNSEPVL